MPNRRTFIRQLGAGAASLAALPVWTCCSGEDTIPPNIIFIMADDLGYGDLKCYGAEQIPTPNIDRIASQGMRFTDAHAPSALCTPTRYGVLTGRYCWRTRLESGTLFGYDPLLIDPGRLTVASLLKGKGYATAAIGKWHLGFGTEGRADFGKSLSPGPLDVGFDYFFGIAASLDMPPYCFIENDRVVGELTVEKDPYHTLQRKGMMTPGWKDEEVGPSLTRKALEFIALQAEKHQPFFLYLPYQAPHTPCTPPDFMKGKSTAGVRGDMVTEFDWMVGEIDAELEKHRISKSTLLIITSDNGAITTGPSAWAAEPPEAYDLAHNGHRPNGDLRGQKSDIFEGGNRVPFIIRWPDVVPAGTVNDHLVCLTDLTATAAGMVSRDLPGNAAEDSFDILDEFTGKAKQSIRNDVVLHSGNGSFSLHRGGWKLEVCPGSGGFSAPEPGPARAAGLPLMQLYHLTEDPAEQHNLQYRYPDKVDELLSVLEGYVKRGRSTPGAPQPNDREVDIRAVLPGLDEIWQPMQVTHLAVGAAVRGIGRSGREALDKLSRLTDGWRGTVAWNDGYWTGIEGEDLAVELDLGKSVIVSTVTVGFLEDQGAWIFLPRQVAVSFSKDGRQYSEEKVTRFDIPRPSPKKRIHDCRIMMNEVSDIRYIRIKVAGQKTCPEWHMGAGGKAWVFCDEIVVE